MSIWACQAKKDVYVEKPLSHNLFEGRKLVEAAKKYKYIVQHGTQNRSLSKWSNLANEIASGKNRKLEVALGTCHKRRGSIGFKDTKNPPSELDFDVWTGPAREGGIHMTTSFTTIGTGFGTMEMEENQTWGQSDKNASPNGHCPNFMDDSSCL